MLLLTFFVLFALGFSFFCSIAEATLLSITPTFAHILEQKGKRSGRILRKLQEDLARPMAAILSLNTIATTGGAAGVGAQSTVVFESVPIGVISGTLTFMILVFAEIIPKTLGVVYWRNLTPLVVQGIALLIFVMYPFVVLSDKLTRLISRGRKPDAFSREEFTAMARLGAQEGKLDTRESRIVRNLFRFPSLRVKDVMTPRTVMFSLKSGMTINEVFQTHPEIAFSRIPIYQEKPDDVVGFVLKSDILLRKAKDQHDLPLHRLKREIRSVPESASLSSTFELLLNEREHILLVVDEYGGLEGVVTLEDLVETLLGLEIVDEADTATDMQAFARTQWEKRARRLGFKR